MTMRSLSFSSQNAVLWSFLHQSALLYLNISEKRRLITGFIRWRLISTRAEPAFLQFDWSKAGLSMDLPVFVYSIRRLASISFKTGKI